VNTLGHAGGAIISGGGILSGGAVLKVKNAQSHRNHTNLTVDTKQGS